MLLNQTDVAVDEEKVILAIDSSTETDFGTMSRATSTLPEKLQNLQWNRGVSTAWMNAYWSECWSLAEITLILMNFDEI